MISLKESQFTSTVSIAICTINKNSQNIPINKIQCIVYSNQRLCLISKRKRLYILALMTTSITKLVLGNQQP